MIDYLVRITFEVDGFVEGSTILKTIEEYVQLQSNSEAKITMFKGAIHRAWIEPRTDTHNTKSGIVGDILIPISTDLVDLAFITALIENIHRIGTHQTRFNLVAIEKTASVKNRIELEANRIREKLPYEKKRLTEQTAKSSSSNMLQTLGMPIDKILCKNRISTFPFIIGLIILLSSYGLLFQRETAFANTIASYAYYTFIIGAVLKLVLYLKDRSS